MSLPGKKLFAFGSNLQGHHGTGSARYAKEHYGAQMGVGVGRTGDAYAIPTRRIIAYKPRFEFENLSLDVIQQHVSDFLDYARHYPELTFEVVAIGCGRAGFDPSRIAPMFQGAPLNCQLPEGWRETYGL